MNTLSQLALGVLCGSAILACTDETPNNTSTKKPATSAQIQVFKDSCMTAGGEVYQTAGCNGTAKCKGSYLNLDDGMKSYNECAGKNACRGIQCLEPNSMGPASSATKTSSSSMMSSSIMSSMAMSSSGAQVQVTKSTIMASTSLQSFQNNCTTAGGQVSSQECSGKNSCAGLYFHTSDNKVSESVCQSHNTCAGSKCEI